MTNDDLADFATTRAKAVPRLKGSGVIVHGIAWCLALALLAFVVPRIEVILKDFGLSYSWSTKVVIGASHLLVVVVPLVGMLLVVDGVVLSALSHQGDGRMSRAWSVLMLGAPFLATALILAAICVPIIQLSQIMRLSG